MKSCQIYLPCFDILVLLFKIYSLIVTFFKIIKQIVGTQSNTRIPITAFQRRFGISWNLKIYFVTD